MELQNQSSWAGDSLGEIKGKELGSQSVWTPPSPGSFHGRSIRMHPAVRDSLHLDVPTPIRTLLWAQTESEHI